jgi:NAD(P)-dependent dehydrogenase (short-subunit alcohol dehydrogenase family)
MAETGAAAENIDILVNNAGVGLYGRLDERTLDEIDRMVQLNVGTLTAMTRLALPAMRARRWGRILNVASIVAYQPGASPATRSDRAPSRPTSTTSHPSAAGRRDNSRPMPPPAPVTSAVRRGLPAVVFTMASRECLLSMRTALPAPLARRRQPSCHLKITAPSRPRR